jgi:RNA-binding protein
VTARNKTSRTQGRQAPRPAGTKSRRPLRASAPSRARVRKRSTGEDDNAPAPVLSSKRIRELRARAHALTPLVHVGQGGVHGPVIVAVRRALRDHELIKVRLHEPEDKLAMAEALATEARAALCGLIGHTVILYRPKPALAREADSD